MTLTKDECQLFDLEDVRTIPCSVGTTFQNTGLTDTTKYPDALLQDFHDQFVELLDECVGGSYCPRTSTYTTVLEGYQEICVPSKHVQEIISIVDSNGKAIDISETTVDRFGNVCFYKCPPCLPCDKYTITYCHGVKKEGDTPDLRVINAAKIFVIREVTTSRSGLSPNLDGITNEFGSIDFGELIGGSRETGNRYIDNVLSNLKSKYRHHIGVI